MNRPDASLMALHEQIAAAGRKFAADVLGSLVSERPVATREIVGALASALAQDDGHWSEMQERYYRRHLELWRTLLQPDTGAAPAAAGTHDSDRRFRASEWHELPYFSYLRQAYQLNALWLTEMVDAAQLDARAKNKLRFFARQLIDAAAPSNYAPTNPEVLKLASETNGASLQRGLELMHADLKKGRISLTDESAFEIARNIAVTPGTVIFENELIQLIQYQPATQSVYQRPLLMVPPFINKYYILDLQPSNSLVRYAVAQGHTVFMISWRNASADMGHVTWDQYVEDGVIRAIDAACDICSAEQINVLGFCVGGTLLASALAVLRARSRGPAASLTLLASMLDFSDPGELSVFVDETYVTQREREFARGGVLRGSQLALTFSSLRANDLIWNYVVNNYLKGRAPAAFDLLYWNSDSTNLPGAMYVYYLRNMYLENNLRVPGRLTMCGAAVDLAQVRTPAYILASREDHIVPWKTAYQSTQLLGGNCRFVLAASGHIAGVINPASDNRRHYWVRRALPASAEGWLAGARQRPGSWWNDWSAWLDRHGGARVPPRMEPGNSRYPVLEPAPGSYVKARCD